MKIKKCFEAENEVGTDVFYKKTWNVIIFSNHVLCQVVDDGHVLDSAVLLQLLPNL